MVKHYEMTFRIPFADTDASGLLHFSQYYKYMERCEHEFLGQIGVAVFDRQEEHLRGWPRKSSSCQFRKPLCFQDEFRVELTIIEARRSGLSYVCNFFKGEDLCAEGAMTIIYTQITEKQGIEKLVLPEALQNWLSRHDIAIS